MAVVGQEQQAFAVMVKPAGWVNAREVYEIRERGPGRASAFGRELAEHAKGLVERNEGHPPRLGA